ncbi:MAG: hypothetical protein ACI9F2_000748 [Lysobacterales bacterium]|jgi:hypothetical protein
MEGVLFTLGRAGSGLWDIVRFNLKIPKHNEPLMKPDFVYQTKADKEAGTGTYKMK